MNIDRYAVFGSPVAHSRSPAIHALFAQQTRQAMSYEKRLAPIDNFGAALQAFIAEGGRGANVTVPFKIDACAAATRLTPRAAAAGAVNTLCFEGGAVLGDNTDGIGLVTDLLANAGVALQGKRILLLGAGGAAQGVVLPLLEHDLATLFIANRTASNAYVLAARCNAARLPLLDAAPPAGLLSPDPLMTRMTAGASRSEHFTQSRTETDGARRRCPVLAGTFAEVDAAFDIVINATAASLIDAVPILSPRIFAPGALAYDMMYDSQPTAFMRMASSHGVMVRDGLGMLVEQAAAAFALWRGVRPETPAVLASLRAAL
ncbi:MAG: shikimate dehydrogenase [Burkholderiaceae bacterium]